MFSFHMAARRKWIWLRFGNEKQTRLEYLNKHCTAQDILNRFYTSCSLKLYDEHDRELNLQDHIEPLREYTLKRHPVWKIKR